MEVERSPGTGLALALLASAATNRLRHELGVTYHVGTDYQLAGPDQAHLTIAADCLDTNAERVASTLLEVVDNIASEVPKRPTWSTSASGSGARSGHPRTRSSGLRPAI